MKKIIVILFAMFICLTPAFASSETNSHGPRPKGHNYSKNRFNRNKAYSKQMYKYRRTKGHVCTADQYSRGNR
jgi:hypothetical protein